MATYDNIADQLLACNSFNEIPHFYRISSYSHTGRHPFEVACAILHHIPAAERKTSLFNKLLADWVYQPPENFVTMWERFHTVLRQQTNVNFEQFEASPIWVQQVWQMFANEIDYRSFIPIRLQNS